MFWIPSLRSKEISLVQYLSLIHIFWQLLVILSVMNLIDRFGVDGYWVGCTNAWTIPGTEDLKPYITAKDKAKKWLFGTVGMAVISAALAAIMMLFMKI